MIEDAAMLTQCIEAAYEPYHLRIGDLPNVSEGIAQDIEENNVWVAIDDGVVIAGIVLIPCETSLLVANLAVDPSYQGQGLARKLMTIAEQACAKAHLKEMRLSTHIDLHENVRMYKHFGWEESGRSGNKISMRKKL